MVNMRRLEILHFLGGAYEWPVSLYGVSAIQGVTKMKKIALEVKKLARSLAVLAAILSPVLHTAPAHAQNFHSWVARNGNDANTCVAISPCLTFAHALSQTQDGGQLSCLDAGSFGGMTIAISVTIDCTATMATPNADLLSECVSSIVINATAPGKVVTLRGLNIAGDNCMGDNGILIIFAAAVYIEDCVVENFSKKGIIDERPTGLTKLVIKNTVVRNNGSAGIVAAAAPKNSVVLENVQSVGNAYGIGVASGNNVVISRSVMSENSIAGIEADPGAQVFVDNSEISHNVSYGVLAMGTVVLANSDISFNSSSISGATTSFGNNRLFGNGGGTAPTPAGGTSTDFGQQ
jgi:hypothetical protein